MIRSRRRPGYTLLEVLLASLIAIMLLAALYLTLNMSLTRMDISRDQVAGNELARAICLTRMTTDLSAAIGVLPVKSGGDTTDTGSSSTTSSTPSTTTGTGTTAATGTTPTTSAATTTTSSDSSANTATAASTTTTDIPFQAGVMGTDKTLSIYVSRVTGFLTDPTADPSGQSPADIQKVTYYLGSNGGLCRQVRPWATADGVMNSSDPDRSNELADTIASEVTDLIFEYYDGGTYASSWDGTLLNTDGKTIAGPPRAVRVTLTFSFLGRGGATVTKRVQHVIPIRAAAGTYVPDTTTTDSSATTTSSSSTAGSTTGGK